MILLLHRIIQRANNSSHPPFRWTDKGRLVNGSIGFEGLTNITISFRLLSFTWFGYRNSTRFFYFTKNRNKKRQSGNSMNIMWPKLKTVLVIFKT